MMTLGHGLVHSDLLSHRTSCDGTCWSLLVSHIVTDLHLIGHALFKA